jgi:hypothetical protein
LFFGRKLSFLGVGIPQFVFHTLNFFFVLLFELCNFFLQLLLCVSGQLGLKIDLARDVSEEELTAFS